MIRARLPELSDDTVTSVRVLYTDLHGVARGKDVPIGDFAEMAEEGVALLRGGHGHRPAPHAGRRRRGGLSRTFARPDLDTLALLPWQPEVAWCLADLAAGRGRRAGARRPARRRPPRGRGATRSSGYGPIVGPELEFFLLERDPDAPNGIRRYVDELSRSTPSARRPTRAASCAGCTEALARLGLGPFAANHEFMNSQYEINLRHSPALDAADRAFMLKAAVKDIAARRGCWRRSWAGRSTTRAARASTSTSRSTARRQRVRRPRRRRRRSDELRALHRRRARARAGADGAARPDGQRLPADPARQPRADARELGPRQPHRVRPRPARARPRDAGRDPRRRRRREPAPAIAAVLLAGLDGVRGSSRRPSRSSATPTGPTTAGAPLPATSAPRSTRSRPTSVLRDALGAADRRRRSSR